MADQVSNNELIQTLEGKIQLVLDGFKKLKQHNHRLSIENESLKNQLEALTAEKKDFTKQESNTKLADYQTVNGNDTKNFKELLDGYIAELEDCIAQLEA